MSETINTLEKFINRKIIVLHTDNSIFQAARAMCDHNIGCVVISDHHGCIVGLVTDRDLTCYPLAYKISPDSPLSEVMTTEPLCASESAALSEVIQIMVENGLRRIPIINKSGNKQKCVGIVTLDDLIVTKSIELNDVIKIITTQVRHIAHLTAPGHAKKSDEQAELRHEAKTSQTLARFEKSVLEKSGLKKAHARTVTSLILSSIVRRLSFTDAAHFISQLPQKLHDDLYDLPAGPDRHVSAKHLISDVCTYLGVSKSEGHEVTEACCAGMANHLDPHELEKVKSQLPSDMSALFKLLEKKKKATAVNLNN
ncbi:MAG: CBS domain-containing protein [Oligoflexia bacterium]|nr:CBS domain-containing protein [Oligoflexia bacterium]